MNTLFEKQHQKLRHISTAFVRSIMKDIHWKARFIGIKGARGVGKTTLLLQYIKLHHLHDDTALYVSLDNIWFSGHTLTDLVDEFVKKGGKHLFIDEVHRYENWSQILKNIYDDYPDLQIVFTGSSMLEILNARADLSRRAVIYTMQGLSYREYLSIEKKTDLPVYTLEDILKHHVEIAEQVNSLLKPLQYFEAYLKKGYYPFYREETDLYEQRLESVVNMMFEIELPLLRQVEMAYIPKLKELLLILSESVPFIPNISKLSDKIGINRITLLQYIQYLDEIGLTYNLYKEAKGISRLQKPNKIYLENTNLMYLFSGNKTDKGSVREVFFTNQVKYSHRIQYSETGDYKINDTYFIEVGGKNKSQKQLEEHAQGYIVADEIEFGHRNKIPLWLFGFLY